MSIASALGRYNELREAVIRDYYGVPKSPTDAEYYGKPRITSQEIEERIRTLALLVENEAQ